MNKYELEVLFEHTQLLRSSNRIDNVPHATRLKLQRGALPWLHALNIFWDDVAEIYVELQKSILTGQGWADCKSESSDHSSGDNLSSDSGTADATDNGPPARTTEDSTNRQTPADADAQPWYRRCYLQPANSCEEHKEADKGQASPRVRFKLLNFDDTASRYGPSQVSRGGAFGEEFGNKTSPADQCFSTSSPASTLKCIVHSSLAGGKCQASGATAPPEFIALSSFVAAPQETLFFFRSVLLSIHRIHADKHYRHIHQLFLDFEDFQVCIYRMRHLPWASIARAKQSHQNEVLSIKELSSLRDELEMHFAECSKRQEHGTRSPSHLCATLGVIPSRNITRIPICIPFVYVQYPGDTQAARQLGPTPPTLFQFLHPKGDVRRDLKQAITQLSTSYRKPYLCVTQLWALLVNDGKSMS
jgi:hypothetical protein